MDSKALKDDLAVIAKAYKLLPCDLYKDFIQALAELENNNNHKKHQFPHTELHKIEGTKNNIYRAYINKTKGWRLHVQYGFGGYLELKDILVGKEHDRVGKIIKSRKNRYN